MKDIKDQARNKWVSILSHFGVDSDLLTGKHGPCPMCGGKDRFRFDDLEGRGTWICNVCGAGDGMHLLILKTRWSFKDAARNIREMLGEATETKASTKIDPERAREAHRALWLASAPLVNDMATGYLASRGIRGPFGNVLRFCASAEVTGHPTKTRLPALLALVSGPDGAAVNIHRTYLENGRKAHWLEDGKPASPRRLMPGGIPDGSAIRLMPHEGVLGVAEGIETAFRAADRFGIPSWAAINATMLEKFIVPPDVTELHIFGDNDRKFGGQAAAYRLAHRAACKRPELIVHVHIPERVGTDWADDEQRQAA